jgi:hypothetical protein
MSNSKRPLSLGIPLTLALFAAGCSFEVPCVGWPALPPPGDPLQVRNVIEMLQAGMDEESILERAREYGISTRPTPNEIRVLREAGASDRLMATLLSAALLEAAECPPMPSIQFQFFLWQPYPPFPGFPPLPGWHWLEGRGQTAPFPERIEP